jgi:hypothetical protein
MRCVNKNRIISGFCISILALIIFSPLSSAVDIPILTWERGKEQNIVLGGSAVPAKWKLVMTDNNGHSLYFTESKSNKKGFIVYSASLSNNLPLGNYYLEVISPDKTSNSIVSGVNVIEMSDYGITRIPFDLKLLVVYFSILVTLLSIIRRKKYRSFISINLSIKPTMENEKTYVLDSLIRKVLNFRANLAKFDSITLFRFLLVRNENQIAGINKEFGGYLIVFGGVAGVFCSLLESGVTHNLSFVVFLTFSALGVLDLIASGFALLTYLSTLIILGNINSVNAFLSYSIPVWGIFFAVHFSELLLIQFIAHERTSGYVFNLKSIFVHGFVLAFSTYSFYIFTILQQSVSGKDIWNLTTRIYLAFLIGLVTLLRIKFSGFLQNRMLGEKEKIESGFVYIDKLQKGNSIAVITLLTAYFGYFWSSNILTAIIMSLIALLIGLLLINDFSYNTEKLPKLSLIHKSVFPDLAATTLLCVLILNYVENWPLVTIDKANWVIYLGLIPAILHVTSGHFYYGVVESGEVES